MTLTLEILLPGLRDLSNWGSHAPVGLETRPEAFGKGGPTAPSADDAKARSRARSAAQPAARPAERAPHQPDWRVQGGWLCKSLISGDGRGLHLQPLPGTSWSCLESAVLAQAGCVFSKGDPLPGASLLFDGAATGPVCADPVHLVAERDHVRLIPAECFALDAAEADALVASINELISPDGLHLTAPEPMSWCLAGAGSAAALDTLPAHAVAHRNLGHFLPRRSEARHWRTLFTECQMLLHDHPVNQARIGRGLPPVNGVWFWGGGTLAELADNAKAGTIRAWITTDRFTLGLARALGQRAMPIDALRTLLVPKDDALSGPPERLMLVERVLYDELLRGTREPAEMQATLDDMHDRIMHPALMALRAGSLRDIVLDDTEGSRWQIRLDTGNGLMKLWRRWRARGA